MYFSESYIEQFCLKMTSAINKITNDYEIILVDDGSRDNSLEKTKDLALKDNRIKIIELSKNFGAAAARWEGMRVSKGELVFTIDADLEEDPEIISKFYNKLLENVKVDAVYGFLESRKGNWKEKITGWIFYKVFKIFSGIEIKGSPVWARLMTRKYVDALLLHNEYFLFAIGIMNIVGFNQIGIPIEKKDKGFTSYSFRKKLSQMISSFISFSDIPLKMISLVGFLIFTIALIFIVFIFTKKLFFEDYQSGWTSLIASLYFVGGINLFALGIIGIYIGKNYQQSKNRPRVIVKNTFNF